MADDTKDEDEKSDEMQLEVSRPNNFSPDITRYLLRRRDSRVQLLFHVTTLRLKLTDTIDKLKPFIQTLRKVETRKNAMVTVGAGTGAIGGSIVLASGAISFNDDEMSLAVFLASIAGVLISFTGAVSCGATNVFADNDVKECMDVLRARCAEISEVVHSVNTKAKELEEQMVLPLVDQELAARNKRLAMALVQFVKIIAGGVASAVGFTTQAAVIAHSHTNLSATTGLVASTSFGKQITDKILTEMMQSKAADVVNSLAAGTIGNTVTTTTAKIGFNRMVKLVTLAFSGVGVVFDLLTCFQTIRLIHSDYPGTAAIFLEEIIDQLREMLKGCEIFLDKVAEIEAGRPRHVLSSR